MPLSLQTEAKRKSGAWLFHVLRFSVLWVINQTNAWRGGRCVKMSWHAFGPNPHLAASGAHTPGPTRQHGLSLYLTGRSWGEIKYRLEVLKHTASCWAHGNVFCSGYKYLFSDIIHQQGACLLPWAQSVSSFSVAGGYVGALVNINPAYLLNLDPDCNKTSLGEMKLFGLLTFCSSAARAKMILVSTKVSRKQFSTYSWAKC